MKRSLLLLPLVLLMTSLYAQKKKTFIPGPKKPSLFGIAFTLTDFNAPKNFGGSSNATTLKIKEMAAGASVYYWKGLTPFIDFSARLNGIFYDYAANFRGKTANTEIGLELEPSISIRPLKDENVWAPFLSAGLGGGIYSGSMGGYIPVGGGLQLNANNATYFILQAQYKWSITPNVLGNNLFYSLGFAQNIGNEETAPKVALPAAPSAPIVLDKDGDGVPDETDACPDEKGIAALKGCPDTDGDGITDKDDKCPTEKGLSKYNGCPIPDTDKDGINDDEDNCKDVAGLARYQGCPIPDTDKDGINDEEDKCKDVAGMANNMGCPEIAATDIERINKAAASIFFGTGSSKLLAKSNTALDNIVTILKANTDYKVDINGFTDNQGNADKNRALSEERAAAVQDYLVKKGIEGNRLSAAGFGDENPVADNKTAAGRAKNRRVEMKVRNY
ncbi:MAG TPA: OmpA family protein [Ferruginibacter sp.]|nr:OmpA family protein [Ferruginibacter sp.]HPH92450.1 OmpA family protein [Ferruginibacter sp.]